MHTIEADYSKVLVVFWFSYLCTYNAKIVLKSILPKASITLSKAIESLFKHCITPRTHAYQTRNVITNTRGSNRKKPHNTNTNNIVQI